MDYDPNDLEAFRGLYDSVSAEPRLLNPREVGESISRHYTAEMRAAGLAGRVLLRLSIDSEGKLQDVQAIDPPRLPGIHAVAVLLHDDGSETVQEGSEVTRDPSLRRTAEDAVRIAHFAPAERDGVAVAFPDYRMSIDFDPTMP